MNKNDVTPRDGETTAITAGGREYILTGEDKAIMDIYLDDFRYGDAGSPLFYSLSERNFGGRLTGRSAGRIIKDALEGANGATVRLNFHSLRRTFKERQRYCVTHVGDDE
jgi:hypothetical protein